MNRKFKSLKILGLILACMVGMNLGLKAMEEEEEINPNVINVRTNNGNINNIPMDIIKIPLGEAVTINIHGCLKLNPSNNRRYRQRTKNCLNYDIENRRLEFLNLTKETTTHHALTNWPLTPSQITKVPIMNYEYYIYRSVALIYEYVSKEEHIAKLLPLIIDNNNKKQKKDLKVWNEQKKEWFEKYETGLLLALYMGVRYLAYLGPFLRMNEGCQEEKIDIGMGNKPDFEYSNYVFNKDEFNEEIFNLIMLIKKIKSLFEEMGNLKKIVGNSTDLKCKTDKELNEYVKIIKTKCIELKKQMEDGILTIDENKDIVSKISYKFSEIINNYISDIYDQIQKDIDERRNLLPTVGEDGKAKDQRKDWGAIDNIGQYCNNKKDSFTIMESHLNKIKEMGIYNEKASGKYIPSSLMVGIYNEFIRYWRYCVCRKLANYFKDRVKIANINKPGWFWEVIKLTPKKDDEFINFMDEINELIAIFENMKKIKTEIYKLDSLDKTEKEIDIVNNKTALFTAVKSVITKIQEDMKDGKQKIGDLEKKIKTHLQKIYLIYNKAQTERTDRVTCGLEKCGNARNILEYRYLEDRLRDLIEKDENLNNKEKKDIIEKIIVEGIGKLRLKNVAKRNENKEINVNQIINEALAQIEKFKEICIKTIG